MQPRIPRSPPVDDVNRGFVQKDGCGSAPANPLPCLLDRADNEGPVVAPECGKLLEALLCQDKIATDDENGSASQIHFPLFIVPSRRRVTVPVRRPFLRSLER